MQEWNGISDAFEQTIVPSYLLIEPRSTDVIIDIASKRYIVASGPSNTAYGNYLKMRGNR